MNMRSPTSQRSQSTEEKCREARQMIKVCQQVSEEASVKSARMRARVEEQTWLRKEAEDNAKKMAEEVVKAGKEGKVIAEKMEDLVAKQVKKTEEAVQRARKYKRLYRKATKRKAGPAKDTTIECGVEEECV